MELQVTVILMLHLVRGICAVPSKGMEIPRDINFPNNDYEVDEVETTTHEDVSPECADFYSFACETVQKKYKIPSTEAHWSFFDVMKNDLDLKFKAMLENTSKVGDTLTIQMAKRAYQNCVDEDVANTRGVSALLDFLDNLGGWSMLRDEPCVSRSYEEYSDLERVAFMRHWTRLIYKLTQQFSTESNVFPFLQVSVVANPANATQNLLRIAPAATVLPEEMLQNAEKYETQVTAYRQYITHVATHLLVRKIITPSRDLRDRIKNDAKKIVEFEIKLAKGLEQSHEYDEEDEVISKMRSELETPELDYWDKMFHEISGPGFNEEVLIENLSYFYYLKTLIEQEQTDTLRMYMMWKVVHHLVPFSTTEIRKKQFDFEKTLTGVQEIRPRSQVCVSDVSEALPYAMLHAYTVQLPNYSQTVNAAQKSVNIIVSEVNKHLSSWSGGENQFDPTLSEVSVYVGAPHWLKTQGMVDRYYKEIYNETGDNYIQYHLAMQRFSAAKALKTLKQTNKGKAWNLEVNKFALSYDPRHKILYVEKFNNPLASLFLAIPITMLRNPLFHLDQIQPVSSVKFDVVVSRKIIQGEIAMSVQNAKDLNDLWFRDTLGCHINKLDSYGVNPLPTKHGALGLDNLVVSAAMNVAQSLFKQRHRHAETPTRPLPDTSENSKNFFVAFATLWCENTRPTKEVLDASLNLHAPHRLRVTSALANSRQFSDTWSCPVNSCLNPSEKCELQRSEDVALPRDFCLENNHFFFSYSWGMGIKVNHTNSTAASCGSQIFYEPEMTDEIKESSRKLVTDETELPSSTIGCKLFKFNILFNVFASFVSFNQTKFNITNIF